MAHAPLLLHVYATFAVGGPQVRFAAIANHYGRRWRHAIVAMDGNLACRERLDSRLDVSFPTITLRKGDTFGNVMHLRNVLRTLCPQRLVTSNWGSIEWAMANVLVGVPHVHVEDGFGPEEREIQLRRRIATRRLVLHRCTTVLPSLTLYRIATDIWHLKPERLHYIPNGVDLDRFAAAPAGGTEEPVIGTVAALRPEKNLQRLLRAFALVVADRPARLVIVGDGPERPALEALAIQLGLGSRVTFTGHQHEPHSWYAKFDIFALTSDTEQMPLSILEAMAAGLPVVATNVGDVASMLPPAGMPYLSPRDEFELAHRLRLLIDAPMDRHRAGAANRTKVTQCYDQMTMFEAYAALFDGADRVMALRPQRLTSTSN